MLDKQDWYESLITDCRAIIVETEFTARWALVEGYHSLGKRLLLDFENFEREKIYGEKILQRVANSLAKSHRTLSYAVQFAQKYPDLSQVPGGKSASWHRITNEILKGQRQLEAEKNKTIKLDSKIDLRFGDFKEVLKDIEPVDLILTDPPYPQEFLHLWEDLAFFAKHKLKDNGYLVAYTGQYHLPEVLQNLTKHLDYVWTFCLYHEGKTQIINGVNVICRWKPVLIFQKNKTKFTKTIQDYVVSEAREKDQHDWQQGLSGVKKFVELFSEQKDTICDPFSGGGTTALACKELSRNFVGAEIDEVTFNLSKGRL